jgi:hypothetical protein
MPLGVRHVVRLALLRIRHIRQGALCDLWSSGTLRPTRWTRVIAFEQCDIPRRQIKVELCFG